MQKPTPPKFVWRDWVIDDPLTNEAARRYGVSPYDATVYWHGWLWRYDGREYQPIGPVSEDDFDQAVRRRLTYWRKIGLMPLNEDDPAQVQAAREQWRKRVWSAPNPW